MFDRVDALRQALIDRKDRARSRVGPAHRAPTTGAAVSFGKRVGDGTAEAVERLSTTATARSIAHSIEDIDRALAKLDVGTYGICDECGAAIGADRLDALPAASRCVECAGRR